jgi:BON domain
MRWPKVSGAALLALGAGAALLIWRNPQARASARQALVDARSRLRSAGIPERLNQWLPAQLARSADQASRTEGLPGVLDLEDENLTTTQRVRTNLGREQDLASVPHFNINTEGDGVVYLRGYVYTADQRRTAEMIAGATEGVNLVVNELHIEQAVNL